MSSINSPICPSRVLQYRKSAEHWSKQTGIPTALILAVIDKESDGRAEATRYEPKYKPSTTHKTAMEKAGVPLEVQKTSYGLMQLMFPVAWGYGARTTADLKDPHLAIRYGAAHLAALASKIKTTGFTPYHIRCIAGAYNGAGAESKYATDIVALYNKYNKEV